MIVEKHTQPPILASPPYGTLSVPHARLLLGVLVLEQVSAAVSAIDHCNSSDIQQKARQYSLAQIVVAYSQHAHDSSGDGRDLPI